MEHVKVILYWNQKQIADVDKEFESEYLLCTAIEKCMRIMGKACENSLEKISKNQDLDGFMTGQGHLDVEVIYNQDVILQTKAKGKTTNFYKVPIIIEGLTKGIVTSLKQMMKIRDIPDEDLEKMMDKIIDFHKHMTRLKSKRLDN